MCSATWAPYLNPRLLSFLPQEILERRTGAVTAVRVYTTGVEGFVHRSDWMFGRGRRGLLLISRG